MKIFKTYGGICHFPVHPFADMHGMVRFCVLAKSETDAKGKLDRYGVRLRYSELGSTWGETQSQIEREVTAGHYGDVFFSKVVDAYLSPSSYMFDKELTFKKREMRKLEAERQGGEVASTERSKERKEFP